VALNPVRVQKTIPAQALRSGISAIRLETEKRQAAYLQDLRGDRWAAAVAPPVAVVVEAAAVLRALRTQQPKATRIRRHKQQLPKWAMTPTTSSAAAVAAAVAAVVAAAAAQDRT
jgi:protein-S-isoprenylcysteine O-methyltransferase Ste14